jgi:hypothetical protein
VATSQLELYNGALRECGCESIRTLTEAREPRYKLDEVWKGGRFVDYLLEQADWNYAMRTVKLEADESLTNEDLGYPYGFEKPEDWKRTAAISASMNFSPPLTQYADENGVWWAGNDILYVQMVSNLPEYGFDYSKWPESFTHWGELELACRVIKRLTSAKTDFEVLKKDRDRAFKKALANDVRGQPAVFPNRGNWTRARGSSRFTDRTERQ